MNTVLIYGLGDEKESRLRAAAAGQGIAVRKVWPGETGRTLLELLREPEDPQAPADGMAETPEIMVMALESREKMESFVDTLRTQEIRIPLKAVLTVHNGLWTLRDLGRELENEHARMMRR